MVALDAMSHRSQDTEHTVEKSQRTLSTEPLKRAHEHSGKPSAKKWFLGKHREGAPSNKELVKF